ncbi:hypothetical protein [Paenibacillus sp.]|uniref:hypothetical protein n=1 Tax=Paenibacillus sp. TaxID=58172 RepID=UPI002D5C0B73|nr:hypothetical protein [Paenibacillus sp.]HZG85746.1 hypothetical protein [Paenibacillus sp.]
MRAKRWYGWAMAVLLAAACAAALAGWSAAEGSARPAEDLAALERLADGIVAEDGRLWVVSVRTSEGLLRWSGDDAAEAREWIERTSAELRGDAPVWFVNVQGPLAAGDGQGLRYRVAAAADAIQVDAYEEPGRTYSYGYRSPMFPSTIGEGDAAIGLQAAAHLDTETGEWRATLGAPAVLIEY